MPEQEVGVVVKFFSKPSVAAIHVTSSSIKKGDVLKFKGHTTDFTDTVASIEIDNKAVEEAPSGSMVGIKVKERVRESDKVYRVVD
jgi:putative protease